MLDSASVTIRQAAVGSAEGDSGSLRSDEAFSVQIGSMLQNLAWRQAVAVSLASTSLGQKQRAYNADKSIGGVVKTICLMSHPSNSLNARQAKPMLAQSLFQGCIPASLCLQTMSCMLWLWLWLSDARKSERIFAGQISCHQ